jgi:hypothetical protein
LTTAEPDRQRGHEHEQAETGVQERGGLDQDEHPHEHHPGIQGDLAVGIRRR